VHSWEEWGGIAMVDAFSVLRRDHEKVERTLASLEDGPNAGSGADQVELIARGRLTQQLMADESGHETIEHQCFWPVVRDRMPGGAGLADEAASQEHEASQMLAQLGELRAWDDGFEKLLREFITAAREHVVFEETRVWPGLREALSAEEVNELGDSLVSAKEKVPTQPPAAG
jgi:hemerythrin-like domain-containing protein